MKNDTTDPTVLYHLENLGLTEHSSFEEVRLAYREHAAILHPDKHKDSKLAKEMFQKLTDSYKYLAEYFKLDPNLRQPGSTVSLEELYEKIIRDNDASKSGETAGSYGQNAEQSIGTKSADFFASFFPQLNSVLFFLFIVVGLVTAAGGLLRGDVSDLIFGFSYPACYALLSSTFIWLISGRFKLWLADIPLLRAFGIRGQTRNGNPRT